VFKKILESCRQENRRWTKLNSEKFWDWQVPFTEYYCDDHLKEDEMGRIQMTTWYCQFKLKVDLERHGRGCEYNIKTGLKI
jgi:hypothetical protein